MANTYELELHASPLLYHLCTSSVPFFVLLFMGSCRYWYAIIRKSSIISFHLLFRKFPGVIKTTINQVQEPAIWAMGIQYVCIYVLSNANLCYIIMHICLIIGLDWINSILLKRGYQPLCWLYYFDAEYSMIWIHGIFRFWCIL